MRTVISPFTRPSQFEPDAAQPFNNWRSDAAQGAANMDPVFAQIENLPQRLECLQQQNQRLTRMHDVAQGRIARLSVKVDELMDCLERRNAHVDYLQRQLDRLQAGRSAEPVIVPPVIAKNQRGHYVQPHFWQRKESVPTVRLCLKLMQYLLLAILGYLVALFLSLLLFPAGVGAVLWALTLSIWQPTLAALILLMLFAWGTEAI